MNWRGRPLTSHEVIIQNISATTTRTGLTVHAQLDTDTYPTGIQVTDQEIAALPIHRHRFHGDWNYTVHPETAQQTPADGNTADEPPPRHEQPQGPAPCDLQDPELTGMTRQQLSEMIDTLTPALERQREQTLDTRRGRPRLLAPGAGAKAKLTPAERILTTVLHQRRLATTELLGQLFGVTAMTISHANQEVRPLLEAHGHRIPASTARFRTPADVTAFLAESTQSKVKPAC
jgi:hypothetical protein